ncbi:MAG: hypothetical protein IJP66_00280 [Kiritimatiellae bacterium]|nr:hypothetical protein [Kiritimatiellia bacterium]
MYSILISGAAALIVFLALYLPGVSARGWAFFFSILAFASSYVAIARAVGARIKAVAMDIQSRMARSQQRMQERTNAWRHRPPGSIRQAQLEIQKLQHSAIADALAATSAMDKYRRWMPMMDRQIATMRMQLHYQDRNWKAVDELLPRCIVIDPMTAAMAIARAYSRDGYRHETDKKGRRRPNDIDRRFERGAARLRYGQGALLFGLYAWIQNREGDPDAALGTLLRADRKMENATIKRNIDLLRNNKPKQFSLAGLGDEWYALGLEEPRFKSPRSHERPF